MERHTIYCTEEQTKKALELGAPIKIAETKYDLYNNHYCFVEDNGPAVIIPTAEQMIGYLETSREISEFDIAKWDEKSWAYKVHLKERPALIGKDLFSSRKEATLAAIDAALDYLSKNNK